MNPHSKAERIQSLDVLRGLALLGILLINILFMGLVTHASESPGYMLDAASLDADLAVWIFSELFVEGAMRALFSMLFGAGVLLFTTGVSAKSGIVYWRRTFWLLMFGVLDAFVLLWSGDILISYALVGALLYWLRNLSSRKLAILILILLGLTTLFHGFINWSTSESHRAAEQVAAAEHPEQLPETVRDMAEGWHDLVEESRYTVLDLTEELAARRGSYAQVFDWNMEQALEVLLIMFPLFIFWDVLLMMLLGMWLYKQGILQGQRTQGFYFRLMVGGFALGLLINGYEVLDNLNHNLDSLLQVSRIPLTYHFGRLSMALGYLGLAIWILKCRPGAAVCRWLAAVGRMALTNYLLQSVIGALLFTGVGLAWVGEYGYAELYLMVLVIWVFQIRFSVWWLGRYSFGPLEWVWRKLTYGGFNSNRTAD